VLLVIVWCLQLYENILCIALEESVGMREQWRKYGSLAQASESRPSESIKNPPWCLCEMSLRRQTPVLSENSSCSSEEVSPKRENMKVPLFYCSSSRLGKRSSPQRELGRDVLKCCFLLCFWWWSHD